MSEYQYYEFRALDKRLTSEQMSELRALSSRAEITPYRFSNEYNYGSFRGDPDELMQSYFDAHIYVSNFGTMRFVLRLPRAILSSDACSPYEVEDGFHGWHNDDFTFLDWSLNEDPSGEWMEGDGWMDRLLPIRNEVVRGDSRSFYIGWLASAWEGYDDSNEEEDDAGNHLTGPPIPAGLDDLTEAQKALAEFLQVDENLIAAAAEHSSARVADSQPEQAEAAWVSAMPEPEVRALLMRVLQGDGQLVQAELQSRYRRPAGQGADADSGVRRSYGELSARAEEIEREQKRLKAEEEAERKRLKAEEEQRKRGERLQGMVPRLPVYWAMVRSKTTEQTASAYETATALLVDMRDAYRLAERDDFMDEFAPYVQQNSRRTALMRRLKEARLPLEEALNSSLKPGE